MAEISDAMSLVLQQAAHRNSKRVHPINLQLSDSDEKIIQQLVRRRFIKRVRTSGIEEYYKMVKGYGPVNYEITKAGLKAIAWE